MLPSEEPETAPHKPQHQLDSNFGCQEHCALSCPHSSPLDLTLEGSRPALTEFRDRPPALKPGLSGDIPLLASGSLLGIWESLKPSTVWLVLGPPTGGDSGQGFSRHLPDCLAVGPHIVAKASGLGNPLLTPFVPGGTFPRRCEKVLTVGCLPVLWVSVPSATQLTAGLRLCSSGPSLRGLQSFSTVVCCDVTGGDDITVAWDMVHCLFQSEQWVRLKPPQVQGIEWAHGPGFSLQLTESQAPGDPVTYRCYSDLLLLWTHQPPFLLLPLPHGSLETSPFFGRYPHLSCSLPDSAPILSFSPAHTGSLVNIALKGCLGVCSSAKLGTEKYWDCVHVHVHVHTPASFPALPELAFLGFGPRSRAVVSFQLLTLSCGQPGPDHRLPGQGRRQLGFLAACHWLQGPAKGPATPGSRQCCAFMYCAPQVCDGSRVRGQGSISDKATISAFCITDLCVAFKPYAPEPGSTCQPRDYYDQKVQMCCSKCPPGHHVKVFCTKTSNTECGLCEKSTYTQLWNWVPKCLSCGAPCSPDQMEAQACTQEQDRICTCKPGHFCLLSKQEGCRLCSPLRKCRPGFGVARPGTATSDVVCTSCPPGTFSNTTSSTDTCRPHQICNVVAIPGNASMDAVCTSVSSTQGVASGPAHLPQPVSTQSQHTEPTPGSSAAPPTSLPLPMGPSPPAEGITTDVSLPVELIVGVTALGLLVIGLVNCVIMTWKKKKTPCLQREAKVPHLPANKALGAPGSEQQHLLTTAPSSSSSSLESSASASDGRAPTSSQPQALGAEKAGGSGDARASSGSSESSPGGHGTQVNVTCIVNVCSSSDHGSRCSSQASSMMGDPDASPSGSPKNDQVPFSKEECAFQSQLEIPETLLQGPEEKPLPLGVPDAGMKTS
ncbi:tumor necrosis factor receptor superfamily member 1B [Carlito syrichta]|uniref:Tumor necrosis factor receptor superfamily member 1B n=1 Tax=Carlito syrichta TaxID=1868482 RepID=A0A3Q0DDP0_CARSF|nr:tumor necrosis factor receptor superfamily member 1B [Carlito syrichta]